MSVEEVQVEEEVAVLQAYRLLLYTVSSFKFLGRLITVVYDNWAVVISNMGKAWKRWSQLLRILVF